MKEVCDLVYFILTDGKTPAQVAELNVLLSDPKEKEEMVARQNAEAMKVLGAGPGMLVPPRRKPRP